MFFGAGNLIYPIFIGAQSLDKFGYGIFGFALSGIVLPLVGLISISLHKGNIKSFFGKIGQLPGTMLILLMLAIMGPFAVIPRCILVSYSGFQLVFKDLSFVYFNTAFCAISGILAINKAKMVEIISKWLTPMLILGVCAIIFAGLWMEGRLLSPRFSSAQIIGLSFIEGYNTMDMCAAFFFSKIALDYLTVMFENKADAKKANLLACFFGMLIISVVYSFLIYVGAKHSLVLSGSSKPDLLVHLALSTLGKFGAPVAALTVTMACITTVIALNELISEYIASEFKINTKVALFAISIASFIFATIGFDFVALLLSGVLKLIYPALVVLAIFNIIGHFIPKLVRFCGTAFWLSVTCSVALNY